MGATTGAGLGAWHPHAGAGVGTGLLQLHAGAGAAFCTAVIGIVMVCPGDEKLIAGIEVLVGGTVTVMGL